MSGRGISEEEEGRELLVMVEGGGESEKVKMRVRGLRKESDAGDTILTGVDVDIPTGMIVGVVGPSGSGKSTFLRALNRLWEPPRGTVFLHGQDVCDLDVVNLRRRVGMLFQLPALFPGAVYGTFEAVRYKVQSICKSVAIQYQIGLLLCRLSVVNNFGSVADNVRYGPNLKGKKLSDKDVHKLLKLADLDSSFSKKNHNELSVGQAQRVALARTLANDPEVLLLDEPTSALDPISTKNIEDALLNLKKNRGMTMVMVSHSIKQIQRVADLVCILENGTIVEVLEPHKLGQAKNPMALRFLQISD